jgi:hypothetical protein
MRQLPICFAFYTCTRGHHRRHTDWAVTLDHWDRQIPLSLFGTRIAHLKVDPAQYEIAKEMATGLVARGFQVIHTEGSWTRGLSMGAGYMADVVTVSKDRRVYAQPYYLHVEDDSPVVSEVVSLEDLLLQSCRMLAEDHEMQTVRVARRGDARGPTVDHPQPDPRLYWSKDVNLQPLLMRSATLYQLGLWLERNPALCQQVQCEQLIRMILDQFSRSEYRHAVWETSYAWSPHLGIPQPEHEAALRQLGLTPPDHA